MARYRDAVRWIADNDDADIGDQEEGGFIVSVCLVADLFGKVAAQVAADVTKQRELNARNSSRAEDR